MKKGAASPLRIPVKNSPRKMFSDMITNYGDTNHSQEINARDYCSSTMRPPLCPIPEDSFNLPGGTNTEQDLITPRPKLDSITHFAQMKLNGPGSVHGFSQSGENTFRGLNCSTPDSDLLNSSTGYSHTKNRFGWQEPRSHPSSATEMDFAKHSTVLTKYPSQGSLHEMGLLCEPTVFSMVGSSENASATPNGVARSLKYNQSVTASIGSLPALPCAESQHVAPFKSLQLESKNNFVQHHFELQEDPSFWDDHNVQVVIRIRPLSGIEVASQGHSRCVRQDSSHTLTWLGNPESRFTFDLVAGEKITQDKLFRVAGLPMVENCMGGYNSCMFAYGQTGSGKTHTMLGDIEDAEQKLSANRGMTPRVFEHLFTRIHKEEDARREEKLKFVCKCSFLEIYNEQVADLLEPSSTNLQMREDARKGVYVENLSEIEVKGVNDVIKLLLQGAANRKVAATNMNRASSRSHSVFTCIIESKWECQSVTHHRFGRLNLVDLAGSERQKSSGAEGERLKEATNINKSLSTLGLVIMNLVNIANGKTQHVPYRDSKLTFLLQDSLGGNSKTIIIANVSPSNCCAMETLSTLKFAQRAKFIRNNATVNENATGDVITLKMQIQQLKEEVSRLRGKHSGEAEHLQEEDYGNMNLLGSPGAYAYDSRGVTSPLLGYKKAPRKRDLESALVGALKRERAMEMQMKAMAAENEQLKCLVKQREEDAQCGKMMLRFREDRIKRLEAVASDKMSAEAHLLEEKTVLMEELQILRNRLDRNPEVTRFAMENIRLMEQLRRFQELYEGGEHEQMVEQIAVLRDQLLEALDWKLMHELDPNFANQKEPSEAEFFSEESEILQKQVDQHRREADALRNNLSFCLEAKEKLERRVDDLMMQIEKMKATATEVTYSPEVETTVEGLSAQRELNDLVDAISVASQREAEAQGNAIFLATEVEDLRRKLRESVDDNKRLIDMFEKVIQERDEIRKAEEDSREVQEKLQEQVLLLRNQVEELQKEIDGQSDTLRKDDYKNNWPDAANVVNSEVEQIVVLRKEVDDLQLKLHDTSEENERLLELYEKAMQEKDEIRKAEKDSREVQIKLQEQVLLLRDQVEGQSSTFKDNCTDNRSGMINVASAEPEQTIVLRKEVEDLQLKLHDTSEENEQLLELYEKAMQERDDLRKMWWDSGENVADIEVGAHEGPRSPETLIVGNDKANFQEYMSVNRDSEAEKEVICLRNEVEEIQMKLKDILEENERLIDMYEKAMQEKDEIRKLWNESVKNNVSSELVANIKNEIESQDLINEVEQQQPELQEGDKEHGFQEESMKNQIEYQKLTRKSENLQTELGRMVQENEKLVKMYEKATQERNELAKQWQKAAESLKHGNIAKNIQMVTGNPTCITFPEELKVEPEAKFQISESDSGPFFSNKGSVDCGTEQVDFGKNIDENPDSPGIFCFLMKEVDKLQSKMKEMAEEYENQRHGQAFQGTEYPIDNFDAHFEQEKGDLEIKKLEELQLLSKEETATNLTINREIIAMDSTINAHNSGAFIPSSSSQNEEKLKVLQEKEQQVQNKFEEMDAKLESFGESMDNLNITKEKLEAELELVCDQCTELGSSITEKETRLQAVQLEHKQLVRKLQESEQYGEELAHVSNTEKGKWVGKEAEVQRGKDLMIERMANREKILLQELTLARSKLVVVQERVEEITQLVDGLSILEKSHKEMEDNRKISVILKKEITYKKEQIDALQICTNEMQAKRVRTFNKLSALKSLLSDLSASEEYWKSRELRANEKVETFTCLMKEKMDELTDLQATKKALEAAIEQTIEMEATAQAEVCELKDKLKLAEQQRVDAEKMVVQLDKQAVVCSDLRSSAEYTPMQLVKAESLLKGEEERINLFNSLKKFMEQVKEHRANIKKLEVKLELVDSSIQQVQSKVNAESAALKEAELVLQRIHYEKQMLIESQEEARQELDILILELQSSEFEVQSKEEELNDRMEDLQDLHNRLCELQNKDKIDQELEPEHYFIRQQVLAKLQDVHASVREAETFIRFPQVA